VCEAVAPGCGEACAAGARKLAVAATAPMTIANKRRGRCVGFLGVGVGAMWEVHPLGEGVRSRAGNATFEVPAARAVGITAVAAWRAILTGCAHAGSRWLLN
jgi:hypothetical protein